MRKFENCITKAHNEPYPYRCYYLNFTSGEASASLVRLQAIAAYINPRINTFLLSKPSWHNCGVILVNFAGGSDDGEVPGELVKTIVKCNKFITPVTIGTQIWASENLSVTNYRNGDPIPKCTDLNEWWNLTTGAYCDYNNDAAQSATYGRLYNWYAVNDSRGLAPAGWHVPSDAEIDLLRNYLGGDYKAGGKLKETGVKHWTTPNNGATNDYGFTALPGGYRGAWGSYKYMGSYCYFWTATSRNQSAAWCDFLLGSNSNMMDEGGDKTYGMSVRLIKDK